MFSRFYCVTFIHFCLIQFSQGQEIEKASPFEARAVDGASVKIEAGQSDISVICFLGTECPLARLYGSRLTQLASQYQSKKVQFIGVNSNQQDSAEDIENYVKQCGVAFPIVKDLGNVIADQYGAKRTPEVVVADRNLVIRYRGRIDDQYEPGITRKQPSQHHLRAAIENLLAGQPVQTPHTQAVGCLIGRVKQPVTDSKVTYCNQVARILQKNCIECHRAGEIGPFSLTDYDEVIGWADMLIEVIDERRMPPWHANPEHGEFVNARHMPEEEKKILNEWVAAGTPYGNAKDLPEPIPFTEGWLLPKQPDLVVPMRNRPFDVAADGTIEYQYFVIDPKFEEDKWVSAAQVIPGNRAVVHHSIVFVRPPDGARFRGVGWLAAYVPGHRETVLPTGHARFVPAGSKLVFQQHYTPNGTAQKDLTKIGIVFSKEQDVSHEIYTIAGIDQEFEIPPHAKNHTVRARIFDDSSARGFLGFPKDGMLLSVSPHMHLRGKSFRFFSNVNSQKEIQLDVPQYDFNWQHVYKFAKPLPLSEMESLEFEVTFDNSDQNPVNPDPSQIVTWGDQTWEEMAVAFFDVSQPVDSHTKSYRSKRRQPESAETSKKADAFVERFFKKFDANQDGHIERSETPLSFKAFGFWRYDRDGDSKLSRSEILEAAKRRLD